MLDSICTLDRQPEAEYSIPPASPTEGKAPSAALAPSAKKKWSHANAGNGGRLSEVDRELLGLDVPTLPTRKRSRDPSLQLAPKAEPPASRLSVAQYLLAGQKSASEEALVPVVPPGGGPSTSVVLAGGDANDGSSVSDE